MSDDDDEITGSESVYKPSFVLIAIDTDPSMFVKKEGSEFSPFKDCLTACYELADSLMLTQNKRSWSPFGIVLACENDIATLVNFRDNLLDSIKFLKEKCNQSEEDLLDTYQRKENFDLSAFFLYCKKKFKRIKSSFYKRTFIYITNDDDPVKGDKNQRFAALNEAKNFEPNEIQFQMVTMNSNFDYKIFYNELFSVIKLKIVETIIEDREGLVEKLSSLIVLRYYQRKLNFFPFKGDHFRFLKVIQKKFIQEQNLDNNAHATSDGKTVRKVSETVADEPECFALKYSQSDQLDFDVQENFDLKNNDLSIGYTLVYVSNCITDVGLILSDTVLVEVDHKEDLPFFNSFWQYCVDKNKVLICVKKFKHLNNVRFVEFIPKFANNTRVFIIKSIPFVTEINNPPTKLEVEKNEQYTSVSDSKRKTTNQLIESLTFNYHPKMFINPSFAKKKAFLRAKFLDEDVQDVEDVTLDNEAIDSRLGEIAEKFKNLFNLEEEIDRKRKFASVSEKSKRKK